MTKVEQLAEIYQLLKQDERLVAKNGELLKNKVFELASNLDPEFLKLICSDEKVKNKFFKEIDGILIFDKNEFNQLIDSKGFLPNSYTKFRNEIVLSDEYGNSIKDSKNVVLEFAGKDCLLEMDSTAETDKRDEIFLNETLASSEIDQLLSPKVFTNIQKHTVDGVEVVNHLTEDDNLIIKGNNLLVLHSLIPKYSGQIKCMYWDILYNTQSDEVPYNDTFKHTSWLTMMKNRLEVAKVLLKEDGVILLQCDDNEMHYLKVLCDEIFGRRNFLNTIVVEMASSGGVKRAHKDKKFIKTKEYLVVYTKNSKININPLYDAEETLDKHYSIYYDQKEYITLSEKLKQMFPDVRVNQNELLKNELVNNWIIENSKNIYRLNGHAAPPWTLSDESEWTLVYENDAIKLYKVKGSNGAEELIRKDKSGKAKDTNLFNLTQKIQIVEGDKKVTVLRGDLWKGFHKDMGNVNKEGDVKLSNGKKPERLISDILTAFTNPGDLVLDAYLGSGTTAAVAHKMNRRYIGIEQLSSHFELAKSRLQNVLKGDKNGISKNVDWQGGGSFVTCELSSYNIKIVDEILNADQERLIEIYKELQSSPFISYRIDLIKMNEKKEDFKLLSVEEQKQLLVSLIEKNNLYVNYSEMEDEQYGFDEKTKAFNHDFYQK